MTIILDSNVLIAALINAGIIWEIVLDHSRVIGPGAHIRTEKLIDNNRYYRYRRRIHGIHKPPR